ncbi:MAG: glycosyltransferase family 4 protein [Anaerolineales bacterium]|nr:glycosyltransferase family 4 protein [Anaerolineales bacterium]MCB8987683.1 glycosyltransferase family 4 protein [Ardenticatenaceae bacterium]
MSERKLRIAGALVGDMQNDPNAKIKYGHFFDALEKHFCLVEVFDANLYGLQRYLNALRSFHPDQQSWRERFYKNVEAFRRRSRRASQHFRQLEGQIDAIVQVGVMFDARWYIQAPPSVIYVDYTAHLAAQRPSAGRSPFTPQQRREWLNLERNTFIKASHICTRSDLVRHSIIHDYGLAPEKVTTIGGGVNLAQLPPLKKRPVTDTPTVLFIGKELYRKGGDILLEAFARARQVVPGARLKMLTIGSVPPHIAEDGIEIISPTWDRQEIAALYNSADVFVLPSRLETWGDVLLEAMSFGLPCIGVSGQAMEEIIEHESSGLLVQAENVAALAEGLVRLLKDADLRQQMGREARLHAEKYFTWPDVAERFSQCLEHAALIDVRDL